jgi:carbon storage regulator CsrA
MLVISRRKGEQVTFVLPDGREVSIVVTEFDGARHKVRLGIAAPPDVPIFREELREVFAARRAGDPPPA